MSIVRTIEARLLVLAALACSTCVVACTSLPPPTIHTAAAPDAPFGRYRTFSFVTPQGAPPGYTAGPRSVEVQQKMRPLIAAALKDKGYREVAEGGDFLVTHGAGRRDATGTRKLSRRAVALMGETEQERTFLEGSLVIDVYDGITLQQVWHGAATAEIDTSGVNEQRLTQTVQNVMAAFPAALHAHAR